MGLFVGIDVGTSGCRAAAVDDAGCQQAEAAVAMPGPLHRGSTSRQDPQLWWTAVVETLTRLAGAIDPGAVRALAVDGTSGTLLLTDSSGRAVAPALMYDDASSREQACRIAAFAPAGCAAHGPSAALAKLLALLELPEAHGARHALHQAEWITARLSGQFTIGDENNCLKLGYDPVVRAWPRWLDRLGVDRTLLPEVVPPGTDIGPLRHEALLRLGYAPDARVASGTTDGVASFLASGADRVGDAVTSLGSTLVLKVMSDLPVFAPADGVYSHRLGAQWLVGGASNSGGAVLLQYFTGTQLEAMTPRLDPDRPTDLDFYPLPAPGERFPYNNPELAPRLNPRPDDDVMFFQGMLEGIAHIEAKGYRRLAELGAPYPSRVLTVGGGARNRAWTEIRRRALRVEIQTARQDQACYGTALLARRALGG